MPDIAAIVLERSPTVARFRSGRCDRGRRCRDAVRDRAARLSAALGRGRARRGRHGGSVSHADRKSRRRHRAVLARPHRGALRPSRGDPRGAAGVARTAGSDPSRADHQGVADARRLRGRVQLARRGQGAAHRAGGLREGDGDARGECRAVGSVAAGRPSARDRPAQLPAWCCARCSRATSISSSRRSPSLPSCRSPRRRAGARPPRGRLQGGVRPRRSAGVGLSGVPRRDRGDARDRPACRAGRQHAAQAPHGRARADKLRRHGGAATSSR